MDACDARLRRGSTGTSRCLARLGRAIGYLWVLDCQSCNRSDGRGHGRCGMAYLLSLLGFPLALVAVVTEKHADAFDGFSRSAAYLYQRPVTVGIGVGIAFLLSYVASLVVEISMGFGRDYILSTYAWNAGQSIQEVQGFGFTFARWLMGSLANGFLFSFFWTASAALYLTLRNEVDHTDFDDVDMDEQPTSSASEKGQAPNPQDNPALSGDNEQAE